MLHLKLVIYAIPENNIQLSDSLLTAIKNLYLENAGITK